MNRLFTHLYPTIWLLFLIGLLTGRQTHAQTITISGNVSPTTSLCASSTVTLSFSTSGTFTSGNSFSLIRSNADGTFSTTPIVIGTLLSAPASATTLILSGNLGAATYGTQYRFRVASSTPARTATTTSDLTIGTDVPTGSSSVTACANSGSQPITVSGQGIRWYTSPADNAPVSATGTAYSVPTSSSLATYYATQTIDGCQSSKLPITVRTQAPDVPTLSRTGSGPFCQYSSTGNVQTITASGTNRIEWFESMTSSTSIAAGSSFTVSTASATPQPVYFRQIVGGCASARTSASITINPAPATAPGFADASYCANTSALLTATLPNGATSARWYPVSAAGTPGTPSDGASIPAPAVTTRYRISALTGTCEGPLSNTYTVTINDRVATPLPDQAGPFCQYSGTGNVRTITAKPTGTGTIEWLASATASTSIAAGNSFTVSTASATPQAVYYRQVTDGCYSSVQSLPVIINARPAIPGVRSLSVCQNDAQQTLTASGTGPTFTWYIQGSTTALAAAPRPLTSQPNSQTVYEVTQTDVNSCTSLRSNGLTFYVRTLPDKPTLSGTYTYCEAQAPTSLTATGVGLRWYADGGTTLGSFLANTSYDAPKSAGTFAFQVTQTDAFGCQGTFLTVPVMVKNTPRPPVSLSAGNVAGFCLGQASGPLSASGTALQWYATVGGAVLAQAPIPATTSTGDTPYYVTQTNSEGCVSSPLTLIARVYAIPQKPTFPAPKAYCADETATPLIANGESLKWYTALTGGSSTSTTIAPTPSTAAATVGTVQAFSVTQTVNGCESSREQINVTVKRRPDKLTNLASPAFCQNYAPVSLSAQAENGATLIWVSNSVTALTPPTVPNTDARSYVYGVFQRLNGCDSDVASLTATVKTTPARPGVTPYSLCVGQPSRALQANAVAGATLAYYDINDQPLGTSAPLPATGQSTTITYKITQVLDGCESPKATYPVPVYPIPGQPTFTQPRDYCAGDVPTSLVASGSGLVWYNTSSGGAGSAQVPTPSTAAANVGTAQSFYVTQTVNSCESGRQQINVTVKRKPDQPVTQSLVEFCQTYPAPMLTATPENGAALTWVANSVTTTTAPTPPNTAAQSITYQVFQTLNGCRSDQAQISVRVKQTPGMPTITPFQLCQFGQGRALQANGSDLTYYDATGNLLGTTAPVLPTATAQTLTYQVTQSLSGCEGPKINYAVVVYPKPAQPITQDVNYCVETASNPDQPTQTVRPLTAQGANLRWYFSDGNEFPSAPTPIVSTTNVNDFRVTQTVNNCLSDYATLRVTVQATPAPTLATSLVTYCRNDVARPLVATGTNLRWIDPSGTLLDQSSTAPTPPTVNATKGGETYQVYSVGTNGCVSPRSVIRLVINTNPTLGLLGSTTVNYGQSTSLRLRFTSSPPYAYTLSDGTSGVAQDTLATIVVKPLQTTTYQVASVSNVCGNGLPGNPATAVITVTIPQLLTQALASNTLCAGTTFAIGYTTSGTFNLGNAFKVQIVDTTATPRTYIDVSTASTNNALTANLPTSLRGGVYFVRVLATNPGAEIGGLPSPTLLTVRGMPGAMLTGTQEIYEGSTANISIALSGDGPWTISYSLDGSQGSTFQTNANPHVLTVQPPRTANYFLTAISNNCGTGVVSGTATITVLPLLAVEDPLTGLVSVYPIPAQNLLTVAIDRLFTPGQPAELQLRDLTGQAVLTRRTDARQTVLDLSQQPAGLYLLSIQVGDQRTVRRVVKL